MIIVYLLPDRSRFSSDNKDYLKNETISFLNSKDQVVTIMKIFLSSPRPTLFSAGISLAFPVVKSITDVDYMSGKSLVLLFFFYYFDQDYFFFPFFV